MSAFFSIPSVSFLRCAAAAGLGASLLLSACGSGSTFEPLVPTRVISFGDGLSDVGQSGGKFTVNDGTVNIWVERVASSYGKTITASVTGGLGFARGLSRTNTGANSTADQIAAFLAANSVGASDLLIVDAGIAELAALAADPANTTDAALASAADAAGKALAAQVLRLTAAGGTHVVIANAPNLGRTPLAVAQNRAAAFTAATRAFNDGLKIALANVTSGVLLVDNEAYVNTLYNSPASLGTGGNTLTATTPACNTATFNTITCNTSTLAVSTATYSLHLFADDRHLGPTAHRLLGDNAYSKIKARW